MSDNLKVFLALEPVFMATARAEFFAGLEERGNLFELPRSVWNDPEALVIKAVGRGAEAIVFMAGSRSPFALSLKAVAARVNLAVVFVETCAPVNLSGFAVSFRNAQRNLIDNRAAAREAQ